MTCEEAEVLIHALIDGELDAGHAREVEAHVEGCAHCAALMKDYQEIRRLGAACGCGSAFSILRRSSSGAL